MSNDEVKEQKIKSFLKKEENKSIKEFIDKIDKFCEKYKKYENFDSDCEEEIKELFNKEKIVFKKMEKLLDGEIKECENIFKSIKEEFNEESVHKAESEREYIFESIKEELNKKTILNFSYREDSDKIKKKEEKAFLEKEKKALLEKKEKALLYSDVLCKIDSHNGNLFERLSKLKNKNQEKEKKIEEIIGDDNGGLRKFILGYNNLNSKCSNLYHILLNTHEEFEKLTNPKKSTEQNKNSINKVLALVNNFQKFKEDFQKFKKENQIKIGDDVSKNQQEDIDENNSKSEEEEKGNADDQKKQNEKENKTIIIDSNEEKNSKFLSYKYFDKRQEKRKENMKEIRNKTRKRAPFDSDRYKFYEEKYMKNFSYLNTTEVANYQFRDLDGDTALNNKPVKKDEKKFRWGVWSNSYSNKEVENYQFRKFGRRNTAFNTELTKKDEKKFRWGVWTNY